MTHFSLHFAQRVRRNQLTRIFEKFFRRRLARLGVALALSTLACAALAQSSAMEPALEAVPAVADVALPAVTPAEVERARQADPHNHIVGLMRELDISDDDWRKLAPAPGRAATIWQLRIDSPWAESLAVEFDALELSPGSSLLVYGLADGGRVRQRRVESAEGAWRSKLIPGGVIVLEWRLPSAASKPAAPRKLLHLLSKRDTAAPTPAFSPPVTGGAVGQQGPESHLVDFCTATETVTVNGEARQRHLYERYGEISQGVLQLLAPDPDSNAVRGCSAALVDNGADGARANYLLSAAHCFRGLHGDLATAPRLLAGGGLTVRWNFIDRDANNGCAGAPAFDSNSIPAHMIAWDRARDYALVRLRDSLPSHVRHLSWSSATLSIDSAGEGPAIFTIGHPNFERQRYASGRIASAFRGYMGLGLLAGVNPCAGDPQLCQGYRVNWDTGRILGGASGSGAFDMRAGRPAHLIGIVATSIADGSAGNLVNFARAFHYDYRLRLALTHGERYYQACALGTASAVNFKCLAPKTTRCSKDGLDCRELSSSNERLCRALDMAEADCALVESVETPVPDGWRLDFDRYERGDSSLRSGLADNKNSCLSLNLSLQETRLLEFRWLVSSEVNFDFLEFSLDGQLRGRISGERGWERRKFRLEAAPAHVLRWCYSNDAGLRQGADVGLVDHLVLHRKALFASIDRTSLREGDGGARLLLERSFDDGELLVNLNLGGGARRGEDYELTLEGDGALDAEGMLRLAAGTRQTTLIIKALDNFRIDADRWLTLRLSAASPTSAGLSVEFPVQKADFDIRILDNEAQIVTDVAAGERHSCVVLDSGSARCWGDNTYGQLRVPNQAVTALALGERHSCFALRAGGVECHGSDVHGVVYSRYTPEKRLGPILLSRATVALASFAIDGGQTQASTSADTVRHLAAGAWHNCAVYDSGALRCWGANTYFSLDYPFSFQFPEVGQAMPSTSALAVSSGISQLALGRRHSCALVEGGVTCWGSDDAKQLQPPLTLRHPAAAHSSQAVSLSAGASHTCAVLDDASVRCWGGEEPLAFRVVNANNDNELLYVLSQTSEARPRGYTDWRVAMEEDYRPPSDLQPTKQLVSGRSYSCALSKTGRVRCWGPEAAALAPPDDLGEAVQLAGGGAHVCARLASGGLRCWGQDRSAQLNAPVRIQGGVRVSILETTPTRIVDVGEVARVMVRIERSAGQDAALRAHIEELGEARAGVDYRLRVVGVTPNLSSSAVTINQSSLTLHVGAEAELIELEVAPVLASTRVRLHWRLAAVQPRSVRFSADEMEMMFLKKGGCPPVTRSILDINGDGSVDGDDLVLLLRGASAGGAQLERNLSPPPASRARIEATLARLRAIDEPDINEDGRLDNVDVRLLARAFLKARSALDSRSRAVAACWTGSTP